jgi:hypothetical protein
VYIAPSDRKKALKKHQGMVVSGYWGALLRWTHWAPLPPSLWSSFSHFSCVCNLCIVHSIYCQMLWCCHVCTFHLE